MAQTVRIANVSYSDVPAILVPTGSGSDTARFTDVSDTTALASDVSSGKYLYLASGQKVAGSLADGNSLEYGIIDDDSPLVGVGLVGDMIIE